MPGVVLSDLEKEFFIDLIGRGVERLEPKITPDGIQYNDIEYDDWRLQVSMLEELAEKGFLKSEDFDRAILCPSCDSPHVYSKYACPTDRSIFIKKVILLRHESDGFQGEIKLFDKKGRLICPQCNQDLGSVNNHNTWDPGLKEIGYSFECESNGHRFERPLVIHNCPSCGSVFDYKTARYIPLTAFTLTQKAYDFVKSSSEIDKLVKPVIDYLKINSLGIQYNFQLKGVSGSTHKFDLAASVGPALLVIDYSFGDPQKLVSLLGKKLDIPGTEVALLDFSDNEELHNLGKVYNIPIIDTGKKNWAQVLDAVIERMKSVPLEKKENQKRRLWERIR